MNYKTPGVYVEEISLFPPSVAPVATAIPAFIGYTSAAQDSSGNAITSFPYLKRISSLLDYETYFGKAQPQEMTVTVASGVPTGIDSSSFTESRYRMYYAMQMYFNNGGGPCYIASVGTYISPSTEVVDRATLLTGLDAIRKKDEPTLLLFPDAVAITGDANDADNTAELANYHDLMQAALQQCADLGDRFLITDLYEGQTMDSLAISNFRTGIGNNHLKYGAVYHPWLRTSLAYYYEDSAISFSGGDLDTRNLADIVARQEAIAQQDIAITNNTLATATTDDATAITAAIKAAQAAITAAEVIAAAPNSTLTDTTPADGVYDPLADAQAALAAAQALNPGDAGALADAQTQASAAVTAIANALNDSAVSNADSAAVFAVFTNDFESQLRQLLATQTINMPPSSSMAGIYAAVDRSRGVWKAPANVSLRSVVEPTVKITNSQQDGLNVDSTGKSINAIRSFAGKGILVWGARTLAGNDNEWRYISVRRFFNMAEESIKKATEGFVFEPNDANTWVKVRSMIENFLSLQWRAGALAGAKPEDAYFVKVGLGSTMTALDILEGRMNVEIGMAVVRPAEFIILKFSHKMQES